MARTVDLTTLRARVRRAGDWENSTDRITTTEVDDAINEGIADTYEQIVKSGGGWKRAESTPATTTQGVQAYALASTVFQLLAVKMTIAGRESSLTNISEIEMPETVDLYQTTGTPLYYCLAGDSLLFAPTPDGSYTYKYSFVPAPTKLTNPADTFDGVAGWERRVVYLAVRELAVKNKEWDLANYADGIVAKETQRIIDAGKRRDPLPATMIDSRGLEQRNKRWSWRKA